LDAPPGAKLRPGVLYRASGLSSSGLDSLALRPLCYNPAQGRPMPLRDHFHSPITDHISWDALHGAWPTLIVIDFGQLIQTRLAKPKP